MTAYKEVELKLAFSDPGVWDKIDEDPIVRKKSIPMSGQMEGLESIYFDTPSQLLRQEGLAYRIRRQGEDWIATIKDEGTSQGGLHQRQEWSVSVEGPVPDLQVFSGTPVWPALEKILGQESLQELFFTRFLRKSFDLITPGGGVVELAADLGEIIAGEKTLPIQEIELELKKGDVADVLKLGCDLAKRYALMPHSHSKYHRGLILAGLPTDKRKKKEEQVDPKERADRALGQVLTNHLHGALKALEDFLAAPEEIENLHQYRVRLRRLRSLLSFCRPLLKRKGHNKARQNLRKLGLDVGPLRELDVMLERLKKKSGAEESAGLNSPLEEVVLQIRNHQRREVLSRISGGRHTRVLLRLWSWLCSEPWKRGAQDDTVGEFVSKRLKNWFRGMYKEGEGEDFQDSYTVHELRIKGKKLRYALEQFKNIGSWESVELINSLKDLQDLLGTYNDIHRNEEIIRGILSGGAGYEIQEEAQIFLQAESQELAEYIKKLKSAWRKFAAALNTQSSTNPSA